MDNRKIALMILDGWGHGPNKKSNAIFSARTPFIDSLYSSALSAELRTDGQYVGLPKGQMGNSEVGHLHIGAGRVVPQELQRINIACSDSSILDKLGFKKTLEYVKNNNKPLHLIGLLSDGGVHSHQNHLYKICQLTQQLEIKNVYIHLFTDGRDTSPTGSVNYIKKLQKNLFGAKIASICGRYYSMDRDQRWERIKIAFDLLTKGIGAETSDLLQSVKNSHKSGITDEFLKPLISVDENGKKIATISEMDAVICFNFRTDRCRQIVQALTQRDFIKYKMKKLNLFFTTMTNYDDSFKNINVIFNKQKITNTLGEVLSKNNKSQLRIAETEKYPHVTYFFSGGLENKFRREHRIIISSPKVETYDLLPEMSAEELTKNLIDELNKNKFDFICHNYANPDMVGHTGNYNAIIKAIETVDKCLQKAVNAAIKKDYIIVIISDHGNAECVINEDHTVNTAHTINPVPIFVINSKFKKLDNGSLKDIAPTILKLMQIKQPKEMTGKSLIK